MGEVVSWFSKTFTPEGEIFGIDWAAGDTKEQATREATKQTEEQAPVIAKAEEDKKRSEADVAAEKERRRIALLNQPTSGYGPNTNLARSFLTTF